MVFGRCDDSRGFGGLHDMSKACGMGKTGSVQAGRATRLSAPYSTPCE